MSSPKAWCFRLSDRQVWFRDSGSRHCHHFLAFLVGASLHRELHLPPPVGWCWQVGRAKGTDRAGLEGVVERWGRSVRSDDFSHWQAILGALLLSCLGHGLSALPENATV